MTGTDARVAALRARVLAALPETHPHPDLADYYRLLRDYPQRDGKLFRGRLTLLSTEAHGAPWRRGLPAAAALELFQNWVLVHDDIEDDSLERRGQPALHQQVGLPLALNAGDGMHAYMWQLLADEASPPAVVRELLTTVHRTAEGQHLDLAWVQQGRFDLSEEDYLTMVRLKTARYTVIAPLRLGALSAGTEPHPALSEAGELLGVAFQIRDDVLNLTQGDAGSEYGKEFAGDLYEAKRTLILAHFFATASAVERQEAIERLAAPRDRRKPEDVRALLAMLHRTGSIRYAQRVAEDHAERGLALLAGLAPDLPGRAATAELLTLVDQVSTRSR